MVVKAFSRKIAVILDRLYCLLNNGIVFVQANQGAVEKRSTKRSKFTQNISGPERVKTAFYSIYSTRFTVRIIEDNDIIKLDVFISQANIPH